MSLDLSVELYVGDEDIFKEAIKLVLGEDMEVLNRLDVYTHDWASSKGEPNGFPDNWAEDTFDHWFNSVIEDIKTNEYHYMTMKHPDKDVRLIANIDWHED